MSVIFWAGLTQVNSSCATAKVGPNRRTRPAVRRREMGARTMGENGAQVECGGGGGGGGEAAAHRASGNACRHGLSGQWSEETTRLALTVRHLRRADGGE